MANIIGQVAGGTISNGQGCYGASLLPVTFKKILLTLAEDRCVLGNSKERHLEQIFISLEFSRYQGSTVFTPGILDKGKLKKACIDNRHRKQD